MKSYITGFVLSLILTLTAFGLVSLYTQPEKDILVLAVILLAILQFFTQMIFFMHLGNESKPKFNLTAFLFTLFVVLTLVIGSLWIMANLDYNMDYQKNIDKEMIEHEGIHATY